MKVGDLVMWIGAKGLPDEYHGDLGVIVSVTEDCWDLFYDIQWSDGILGKRLRKEEIMAINDEIS